MSIKYISVKHFYTLAYIFDINTSKKYQHGYFICHETIRIKHCLVKQKKTPVNVKYEMFYTNLSIATMEPNTIKQDKTK